MFYASVSKLQSAFLKNIDADSDFDEDFP